MTTRCKFGWLSKPRSRRVISAGAGLLLVAVMLLQFGSFYQSVGGGNGARNPAPLLPNTSALAKTAGVPWYIRSGQWRADARSLAAVIRYLTDSDQGTPTNGIPAKADNV